MKIQRFENINESKNPFLNEPWTNEKLEKIHTTKKQIKEAERSLYPILTKYFLLHPELQDDPGIKLIPEETQILGYSLVNDNKYYKLNFSYYAEEDDIDEFYGNMNHTQYQDFLEFLKDPDMYINANKYNL